MRSCICGALTDEFAAAELLLLLLLELLLLAGGTRKSSLLELELLLELLDMLPSCRSLHSLV
jgi:hypothetical protein